MAFTIAIVGRPNVGKSTMFNRLIGKSMALVADTPGVTRDWRDGDGELFGLRFRLMDTAGLENARKKGSLAARAADHTFRALSSANVILMMVDGKAGLTEGDRTVAAEVRKLGKPVILLVNKCESTRLPAGYNETAELGFPETIAISALHGDGLDDLAAALSVYAIDAADSDDDDAPDTSDEGEGEDDGEEDSAPSNLHIAVVGRPNAGKSTMVNRLTGEDRLLTGPEPGLTRDAIPIKWEYRGRPIRLVDTAGLRRRSRIEEELEKMGAHESKRAIRLAHVAILVIDAAQPFDKQDYAIARHVAEEGRALIIAVNKWDTVDAKPELMKMIKAKVEASLAQVSGVPVVPISALNGEGLDKLMKEVIRIYDVWNLRVSTSRLNRWLEKMEDNHPPPIVSGRRVKLRYMTQVKSRPPTFALWVNKPVDLPESYLRFLIGGLRETFGFDGVPIRWQLRKGDNPYEKKRK